MVEYKLGLCMALGSDPSNRAHLPIHLLKLGPVVTPVIVYRCLRQDYKFKANPDCLVRH